MDKQTAEFTAIPYIPKGFQAREIGEGDWFDVSMDDMDQVLYYMFSPQYDYRWVWE